MILRGDGACVEVARGGQGPQVVVQQDRATCNGSAHQQWSRGAEVVGAGAVSRTQLHPASAPSMCLASGPVGSVAADPWCAEVCTQVLHPPQHTTTRLPWMSLIDSL